MNSWLKTWSCCQRAMGEAMGTVAFTLKTFRPARSDIVAGVEGHFLEEVLRLRCGGWKQRRNTRSQTDKIQQQAGRQANKQL
jgi:hypothetical protein